MVIENYKSFKELVDNARTIKTYYLGLLSSFSIYEIRKQNEMVYNLRKGLYSKGIDTWKIDKIWEYLNNDINYYDLFAFRNL